MSKDREMTDDEVAAYERIHGYDDPLAVEEGKIRRERAASARYRRKRDVRLARRIRNIRTPEDVGDWEEDPELAEYDLKSRRELGNARTHRRRLKGLKKHLARSGATSEDWEATEDEQDLPED